MQEKEIKICEYCNKRFTVIWKPNKNRFCSHKCYSLSLSKTIPVLLKRHDKKVRRYEK